MDMHQPFHIVPKESAGTRRAVMIGINYKGEGKLSGCHHDVKNVRVYVSIIHHGEIKIVRVLQSHCRAQE